MATLSSNRRKRLGSGCNLSSWNYVLCFPALNPRLNSLNVGISSYSPCNTTDRSANYDTLNILPSEWAHAYECLRVGGFWQWGAAAGCCRAINVFCMRCMPAPRQSTNRWAHRWQMCLHMHLYVLFISAIRTLQVKCANLIWMSTV